MTRQGHTSNQGRGHGGGSPVRTGHTVDEERPFAEIRKNLQDVLRMVSVHRWAFLVPCSLAASVVFVLSLYYPRTYVATASFERRADPIMDDLPTPAVAEAYDYFRNTMVRDLTSPGCMVEVVDNLGLTKDLKRNADGTLTKASLGRREELARSLAAGLVITTRSPSPHIDLITITYTSSDPQIGRRLVNQMKTAYIGHTLDWMTEYLQNKHEYFSGEAATAMEEVNAAMRKHTKQFLDHPHFNPSDPSAIVARIFQLELERRELLLRRREYEAQLAAERQMLATLPSLPPSSAGRANRADALTPADLLSPQALALSAKIEALTDEIEERKALRGMTDEHPEIKERLTERHWLEAALEKQCSRDQQLAVTNGPLDTDVADAETDIPLTQWPPDRARQSIQISALGARIREIDISLETNELALAEARRARQHVYEKQEEFAAIQAEVAKVRNRHARLDDVLTALGPAIKAIKQHRLLRFSEAGPARGGSIPTSPKATTIMLLAILAGIAAGAAFVILAEIVDRVYRSSGQVARSLGLPILEAIDEIVTPQRKRRAVVQRLVITPLILGSLIGVAGVTGSMAYLSIQQPWTYEKIKSIPDKTLGLFAAEQGSGTAKLAAHLPEPARPPAS